MEEISVNGEIYTKASILAKNFGYTADYIGQLCRSGQVKATLVGRSWYVNEDSVRQHRKGRYRSNAAKAKDHVRQVVEDRVVKSRSSASSFTPKSRYEADESALLPLIKKLGREEEVEDVPEEENKAENKVEITLKTTSTLQEKPVVRSGPSPVLRTIPRPLPDLAKKEQSRVALTPKNRTVRSPVAPVRTRRPSLIAAFALVIGILAVESALLFGALGLEKKVLVNADNQAMVLYAFDANQALTPIKDALFVR